MNEKDRRHAEGGMNLLQSFLGVGENKEEEEEEAEEGREEVRDLRPAPKATSINDGGTDLRKRTGKQVHTSQ